MSLSADDGRLGASIRFFVGGSLFVSLRESPRDAVAMGDVLNITRKRRYAQQVSNFSDGHRKHPWQYPSHNFATRRSAPLRAALAALHVQFYTIQWHHHTSGAALFSASGFLVGCGLTSAGRRPLCIYLCQLARRWLHCPVSTMLWMPERGGFRTTSASGSYRRTVQMPNRNP